MKIIFLTLIVSITFILAGCGEKSVAENTNKPAESTVPFVGDLTTVFPKDVTTTGEVRILNDYLTPRNQTIVANKFILHSTDKATSDPINCCGIFRDFTPEYALENVVHAYYYPVNILKTENIPPGGAITISENGWGVSVDVGRFATAAQAAEAVKHLNAEPYGHAWSKSNLVFWTEAKNFEF